MFDKELYVETCSALHASEDTLAEVLKNTSQTKKKARFLPRPALALSLILVLLVSSAALAAGNRILYGGWPRHASLHEAEKMGFHYPKQLGEYRLSIDSSCRMHIAPAKSTELVAWFRPDYTWMSLDYENDEKQSLSVSFGKMDNPLWAYCFEYEEDTGEWLGAKNLENCAWFSADSRSYIENVTEYEYEGCTIYLADRITEYFSENDAAAKKSDKQRPIAYQNTETEAHWTDSGIGLCFSVSSHKVLVWTEEQLPSPDTVDMTQSEMLNYVRAIIDHNH